MMRSLFSGVSGLKTHQTKMDVIGNNIANVNTVAFKSSATTFSDIMYQMMSGASGATATKGGVNPNQIGLGVSTGATKVTISHSGAAQSTGEGLDIRLSDTKSTNFFIVSNGTQNVFTRSGSFYVDGNGNLAMTSTGYLVMGWQVDPNTNQIARDTVSPLRIMSEENMTSEPEWTSQATMSGVLDDTDVNVNSTDGYASTLVFYDNLGYAYTARFSIKKGLDETDAATGKTTVKNGYTIELTNIYSNSEKDSDGNPVDILKNYLDLNSSTADARDLLMSKIYGDIDGKETDNFLLNSGYEQITRDGKFYVQHKVGANTYEIEIATTGNDGTVTPNAEILNALKATEDANRIVTFKQVVKQGETAGPDQKITLAEMFKGISGSLTNYASNGANLEISYNLEKHSLGVSYPSVNYDLMFNTNDGTFSSIEGKAGTKDPSTSADKTSSDSAMLNMSVLGSQFTDINIDYTQMLNYYNGGSSTVGMDCGTVDDKSVGAGKKLGAMTGIAIQQDGKIFGSYDNGNTVLLGQIAVAQFANASGLEALGDNCYGTTLNSGQFDGIGVEVTADGSSMETGQLEMSNVDLSTEFTEMITTQRGFQANSRIITVSDTMLEELTNLKR